MFWHLRCADDFRTVSIQRNISWYIYCLSYSDFIYIHFMNFSIRTTKLHNFWRYILYDQIQRVFIQNVFHSFPWSVKQKNVYRNGQRISIFKTIISDIRLFLATQFVCMLRVSAQAYTRWGNEHMSWRARLYMSMRKSVYK